MRCSVGLSRTEALYGTIPEYRTVESLNLHSPSGIRRKTRSEGTQILRRSDHHPDLKSPIHEVAKAIAPFDTIINAVNAHEQLSQIDLANAIAKAATCKRFVPCGFAPVCPASGVMLLQNWEEVHQRIWYHRLPYTIIDVGFWHQLPWPRVPSGRLTMSL